jgi:hypothetical protein
MFSDILPKLNMGAKAVELTEKFGSRVQAVTGQGRAAR